MGATQTEPRWARLHSDVNRGLRRGAWYRVIGFADDDAVLDVNRAPLRVPRALLQVVTSPPRRWSVVPRPRDAVKLPLQWGDHYVICPSCRQRARIKRHALSMPCHRCDGVFPIAWDEFNVSRRYDAMLRAGRS